MDDKGKGQKNKRKSAKTANAPDLGGVKPTEAGTSGVSCNTLDINSRDGIQSVYSSSGKLTVFGSNVNIECQVNTAAVNKKAKASRTGKKRRDVGDASGTRGAGVSGWSLATEGETGKNLDPNGGKTDDARGAGVSGWSLATEGETGKNLDPNDEEADGARGAGVSGWLLATEGETGKNLDPNDEEADGARGAGVSGWLLATEGETGKNLDPNDEDASGARGAGVSGWLLATEGETGKNLDPNGGETDDARGAGVSGWSLATEGKTGKNLDPTMVVSVNVRPEKEQSGNRRFIVNVRPSLMEAVSKGPGLEQSERGRAMSTGPGKESSAHEGWGDVKFGSGRLTTTPSGRNDVPEATNDVPEMGGPEVIVPYVEDADVTRWNYIEGYQTTYAAVVGTDRRFVRDGRVDARAVPKLEAMPPTSSTAPCDIGKVQPELRADTRADDNVRMLPEQGSVFTSLQRDTGDYIPGDPQPVQADEVVAQTSKQRCFSETSGTALTPAHKQKLLHQARIFMAKFHGGRQEVVSATTESQEDESDAEAVSQTTHSRRTVSAHAGTRTRSESRKRNREDDHRSNIGTPARKKGRQSAEPMDTTEKSNHRSQSLCRIPSTPMEHDGEDGAVHVSEHPPRKSRDRRTHSQIERSENEAKLASAGGEVVKRVVSNTKSLSPMECEIPHTAEQVEAVSELPYIIIDYDDLFTHDETGKTETWRREHVMSWKRHESTATSELEATGDASTYDSERASETEDDGSNIQSVQEALLDVLRPAVLLPTDELLEEPNLFELMGSGIQPDQEAEAETWTDAKTLGEWSNELQIMFSPRRERDPMLSERRGQQRRMTPFKDVQVGGSRDLYVVKRAEIDFKRVNDCGDDGTSPGGSEVTSPGPNTTVHGGRVRTPPDMIPIRVDVVLETEEELPPSSSSSDEYDGRRRCRQRHTAEHRRRRRTELCLQRDEHVEVLRREASAERKNGAAHYTIREANVANVVDLVTNTNSISGGPEAVDPMDVTMSQRQMSQSAPPAGSGHDGNGAGGGEMEDGRTSPELDGGSGGTVHPEKDDGIGAETTGTDFTNDAARKAHLVEMRAADVKGPDGDEPEDGGPQSSESAAEVTVVDEIRKGRPIIKTTSPRPSTSEEQSDKVEESRSTDDGAGVRQRGEKVDNSVTPRADTLTPPCAMMTGRLDGGNEPPTSTVKLSDAVCSPKRAVRKATTSNSQEVRNDGESTSKSGRSAADVKQRNDAAASKAMGSKYRQVTSSLASTSGGQPRDLILSDAELDNAQRPNIFSPRSDSDYDSLQQSRYNPREPRSRIPQINSGIITRTSKRMVFMMEELDREMNIAFDKAKEREDGVKRRKISATREQLAKECTRDVAEFRSVLQEILDRGYTDIQNLVDSTEGTSVSQLGRRVTTSLTVGTDDRSTPSVSSPLTTNSFSSTTGSRSVSHLAPSGVSSGSHAGTSASTDRDVSLTPEEKQNRARGSRSTGSHRRRRRSSRHDNEEADEQMDESSQEGTVTKSKERVPGPCVGMDDDLDYSVSSDEDIDPVTKGTKESGAAKHKEKEPASETEEDSDDNDATSGSHKHQQGEQQLPGSRDYLLTDEAYIQRSQLRLRDTNHSSPLHKKKKRTDIKGVHEPVSRQCPRRPIVPVKWMSEAGNRDGAKYLWETTNRRDTGKAQSKMTTEGLKPFLIGVTDIVYVDMTWKWAGLQENDFPMDPISRSRTVDQDKVMLNEKRHSDLALRAGYLVPETERDTRHRMQALMESLRKDQGTTKIRLPRTLAGVYKPTAEEGFGLRAAKYWYSLTRPAVTLWGEKAMVDTRQETMRFEEKVLELTKARHLVLPMDIAKFLTEGEIILRDATIEATEGLCEETVEKQIQNTAMTFVHGAQLRLSRRMKLSDSPAQYVHGMVRIPLNEHSCSDDKGLLTGVDHDNERWEDQMMRNRKTSYQFGVVQRIIRWIWWHFQEYKRLVEDNRCDGAELNPRTAQMLHLSHWPQQMFNAYEAEIREVVKEASDSYISANDEGTTRERVTQLFTNTKLTEGQKKEKREESQHNQKEVVTAYVNLKVPPRDTPAVEQPPVPTVSSVVVAVQRSTKDEPREAKKHTSTSHRSGDTGRKSERDGMITMTVDNIQPRKRTEAITTDRMEAGTSSGRSSDRRTGPPTGLRRTFLTTAKESKVVRPSRSTSASGKYRDLSRTSKKTARSKPEHDGRTDRKSSQASSGKGSSSKGDAHRRTEKYERSHRGKETAHPPKAAREDSDPDAERF